MTREFLALADSRPSIPREHTMNRLLALLTVGLLAGAAGADVLPPKGFKLVDLDYKITTDKEYADYAFFTVINQKATPVKLGPKTPLDILAKDRPLPYMTCALVAVPKDAAKKYDGEKEFHAAVAAGKVEGQVRAEKQLFYTRKQVKDTEKRDLIVVEYTLEKIEGKEIVLKEKPDGAKDAPKKDGEKKDEKKDSPEDEPLAVAPRGGTWVAGLAASLGVTFGGLWLVGRARRKA